MRGKMLSLKLASTVTPIWFMTMVRSHLDVVFSTLCLAVEDYSCNYLVRFYGISVREGLGNDGRIPAHRHPKTKLLSTLTFWFLIIVIRQFGRWWTTIWSLTIFRLLKWCYRLYLVDSLHTREESRLFGQIKVDEAYWFLRIVLSYRRNCE